VSTRRVRYVDLPRQYRAHQEQFDYEIRKVLEKGDFIMGARVEEFERDFAAYCGTSSALGVANGTDALFLVMKALGIGEGDEVITVPNSFIATAAAIANLHARPVFVDVGDDYLMDVQQVAKAITKRTKAILPVHLTGRPADMDAILAIAGKHKLSVIEDAAQAVGARYKGKRVGSFGVAGCFSLHPLKTLNAYGDGGMISTNDPKLYATLKKLRNHGLRNRDECEMFGFNSRLDTIQAALVSVKLPLLDSWNARAREIAAFYRRELKGLVQCPEDKPHEEPVYHTFVVQAERRDELQSFLLAEGVETKIHYPIPIHLQDAAKYLCCKKGDFPVAERQASRILSLPIYPELEEAELQHVVASIKKFYK
jgi:dTDP-4-amino-4,6-dideoxygalactose transaminase